MLPLSERERNDKQLRRRRTLSIVQQTESQKEEAQLDHDVAQSKLQLESDLLETKRELSVAEQKLEQLKSNIPLSAQDILSAEADVRDLKAGVDGIRRLKEELFPAE